jgi:hypothetical protein
VNGDPLTLHDPDATETSAHAADGPLRECGMTYDTAVWKPANDLIDPTAEFERRFEESEARFPNYRTPIPELVQMADLLEAEFTGPSPWEDLRNSLDGDFLYLTIGYDEGSTVEAFIARNAAALGLVVYSPLTEDFIGPND